MTEVVTLPEFPNHEIHRDGRVFRVRGTGVGEIRSHRGNNYGHLKIKFRHSGKRSCFWLHRLICRAFHGEPPVYDGEDAFVRHMDGDPTNNSADNLRYGSKVENENDKKRFCAPLVGRVTDELGEGYDAEFFG